MQAALIGYIVSLKYVCHYNLLKGDRILTQHFLQNLILYPHVIKQTFPLLRYTAAGFPEHTKKTFGDFQ